MKKILLAISFLSLLCASFSCSDWTETEAVKYVKDDGKTDEYYAALREWKAENKHDMAFGWFGFWSGTGTSLNNSMIGIPDSVQMISVWGPWMPSTLTPNKKKDMEHLQRVKGTKIVVASITGWVGTDISPDMKDYEAREKLWGWEQGWNTAATWCSTDPEIRVRQEESIRRYARAMKDSVLRGGYDGLDIDYEPVNGGTGCKQELSNKDNFFVFVEELGKYFGPKSGTDKLLVIDGNVYYIHGKTSVYFDYFIEQAYGSSSFSSLDGRFKMLADACKGFIEPQEVAEKYLATVNFESYAPSGGSSFKRPDGSSVYQLRGFAEWKPTYEGQTYEKGGFGAYHMEMEYVVAGKEGFYPWLREAIQTVHPSTEN